VPGEAVPLTCIAIELLIGHGAGAACRSGCEQSGQCSHMLRRYDVGFHDQLMRVIENLNEAK
jgi:hypothetical protein